MHKQYSLVGCFLLLVSFWSSALAQPFVWPDAWSVDAAEIQERLAEGELPRMTLRNATSSGVRTFNPIISSESNSVVDLEQALGARLLTKGPDSEEWLPFGASGFEVSEDGLVVDVTLREGVRWSDGTPVTIEDYLLTYTLELDPDIGAAGFDGWFIEGEQIMLEALDERTLRFTFPAPDRIAFVLVGSLLPTPDHILGEIYREGGAEAFRQAWGTDTDPNDTVWTGPWVPTSYSPDERVIFQRNPHYGEWNVDAAGNPLPYISEIVTTIADQQAQLNLYIAGELDLYNPANLDEIGVINVAIADEDIDATILEDASPVASSTFFVFNWNLARDPWLETLFRDVRFRQAMSHLTDREAIVDLVYGGSAVPAFSSVYAVLDFWVYHDAPSFDYDPEAALALLAELGFEERNGQGILVDGEGRELSFTIATNSGNANREQTLQIISDAMREVGVDAQILTLDFNLLVDQLLSEGEDRPFEAILIGLSGGNRDWPFGTNTVACTGNLHMYNRSGECLTDEELRAEQLFFQGRQTLDTDEAQQIAFELQRVESELLPVIYTVSPMAHFSWLNRLGGAHPEELIDAIVGSRQTVLSFIRD